MDQDLGSSASLETANRSVASSGPQPRASHHRHHPRSRTPYCSLSSFESSHRMRCLVYSKSRCFAARFPLVSTPADCICLPIPTPPSPTRCRIGSQSDEKENQSGAIGRARCFRVRSLVKKRLKMDGRRTGLRALRSSPSRRGSCDGRGTGLCRVCRIYRYVNEKTARARKVLGATVRDINERLMLFCTVNIGMTPSHGSAGGRVA